MSVSLYQVERRTLCNYIPNFESLVPNEQFIKLMTHETKFLAKYVENCLNKLERRFFKYYSGLKIKLFMQ